MISSTSLLTTPLLRFVVTFCLMLSGGATFFIFGRALPDNAWGHAGSLAWIFSGIALGMFYAFYTDPRERRRAERARVRRAIERDYSRYGWERS